MVGQMDVERCIWAETRLPLHLRKSTVSALLCVGFVVRLALTMWSQRWPQASYMLPVWRTLVEKKSTFPVLPAKVP